MKTATATVLASLALFAATTNAHGRMTKPAHRGYIGKLPEFKDVVPIDYSDNGLNAGGIAQTSGGKHGVCGDPYSGVREHETGGTYGVFPTQGAKAIAACYAPGSTIDITVQVTANHMGVFHFGLCKLNGKADKETEECFQTLAQPNGQQTWPVSSGNQDFTTQWVLPQGVTCDGDSHCVLRWEYEGGNNPGVGPLGQEWFWNCADVYISNTCGATPASSSMAPAPSTFAPVPSPSSSIAPVPSPSSAYPSTVAPSPSHDDDDHGNDDDNEDDDGGDDDDDEIAGAWDQCGGKHFKGSPTCPEGTLCVLVSDWYSTCVPVSKLHG
ncbi:Aste57867_19177 [Aphanomyces stellatus]|uniref:Aste57867_19177 protein n=1 Tax=Aphanomyces stellatus TaxID=120398 RepID=A0A485LC55_9STRA|nr:hypothetical protein As57867_019113 [Aphanomyces stellatus]VFT95899.1 Aste57867_19177 [Aphanomyces stellatus]